MLKNALFAILFFGLFVRCTQEPSPPLSPEEALSAFELPPGFRIELVAAEPMVQDPVAFAFDEDGRLWVVEMLGFMPDIDGNGEDAKIGRVSILTDEDGDGKMDSGVVFLDSLVLPRAIAIVKGGALIAENIPLWYVEDTDGDLRADKKTLVDPEYGGRGLIEHSANGLWRGMDNWYYNAKSESRYRLQNGRWVKGATEFRGQWGICHDDVGRLHYNYNWSQLHADLVPPNYLDRNPHHTPTSGIDHGLTLDRRIYPIRSNTAVNRGYVPGTLDEEGKLLEFASACSPFIYRGDAFPPDFRGNAFVCEPTANLIKRNIVEEDGVMLSARNAYDGREFLASTDERFRPVFLASGPDGALYVADMYRGIIQHGPYMTPYLREETLKRKLDRPINMGRIWRIVPSDRQRPRPEKLSEASSRQLVETLVHSNGWHRDMAQRLLVERGNTSVISDLNDLALREVFFPARLHALWTLDGLGALSSDLCFEMLSDPHPRIRAAAIQLLEPRVREDDRVMAGLAAALIEEWKEEDPVTTLQIALTAGGIPGETSLPLLQEIIERNYASPLMRDAVLSSLGDREFPFLMRLLGSPQWQDHQPEKEVFLEMLASSVAVKGDGEELAALLTLLNVDPDKAGWRERALLNGMALQATARGADPVALSSEPAVFSRIGSFDAVIQSRLKALLPAFSWPGHTPETVIVESAMSEEVAQQFALGRRQYLNVCAGCHGNDGAGLNRFAPPLVGSEWVLGDERRLALIILQGLEGPLEVNGKYYDAPDILPVMPSHSVLDDRTIASILTYIRKEWGHAAEAVQPRTIGQIRFTSQGRVQPWTAAELLEVEGD